MTPSNENEKIARQAAHSVRPIDFGSTEAIKIVAELLDQRDLAHRNELEEARKEIVELKRSLLSYQGEVSLGANRGIRKIQDLQAELADAKKEIEQLRKRKHIPGCYMVYGDCTCLELYEKKQQEKEVLLTDYQAAINARDSVTQDRNYLQSELAEAKKEIERWEEIWKRYNEDGRKLEALNQKLVAALKWLRQTIHQAYHDGEIETCGKNICGAISQSLAKSKAMKSEGEK